MILLRRFGLLVVVEKNVSSQSLAKAGFERKSTVEVAIKRVVFANRSMLVIGAKEWHFLGDSERS